MPTPTDAPTDDRIRVVGVAYKRPNEYGDFNVMIKDPKYADTVLVFNDNVLDATSPNPAPGGGSAAIRLHACRYAPRAPPRAAGIPTGWCVSSGGFVLGHDGELEPFAARAIVLAIERLVLVCIQHRATVKRIVFSCDPSDPTRIGTAIFSLDPKVRRFIQTRLDDVPARVAANDSKFTLSRIDELEATQVRPVAQLHARLATRGPAPTPPSGGATTLFCVSKHVMNDAEARSRGATRVGRTEGGDHVYRLSAKRPLDALTPPDNASRFRVSSFF